MAIWNAQTSCYNKSCNNSNGHRLIKENPKTRRTLIGQKVKFTVKAFSHLKKTSGNYRNLNS